MAGGFPVLLSAAAAEVIESDSAEEKAEHCKGRWFWHFDDDEVSLRHVLRLKSPLTEVVAISRSGWF